jgi:hypothetical protein
VSTIRASSGKTMLTRRRRLRASGRIRRLLGVVAAVALLPAGAQETAHADADSMAVKIARIQETGARPRPQDAAPIRTTFTDREVNAYLELDGPMFLPPGIASPRVSLGDGGRVTARAIVDLDAVRLARPRGLLDPLAFVRGSLEVVATGSIRANDGTGIGHFESATVAGVPVPQRVAQELLRFYTRTPERPEGFGLDTPFELPAGIRSVTVEAGRATVVQ